MCITGGARTIVVTFDQYLSPSIKDNERLLRGSKEDRAFYIHGPDQRRPADFFSELKNVNFKKALVNFFISDWKLNHYAPFMKNKNVFLNYETCYKYSVTNDIIAKEIDDVLKCPYTKRPSRK